MIDIKLHSSIGCAGAIQALYPDARLFQILRLGRNHQQGIQPFDRNDAEHAGQGALCLVAHNFLKLGEGGLDIHALERKHSYGHAGNPVHVENIDSFHEMAQFPCIAAEEQHVARIVHPHDAAIGSEWLQNLDHFACGNKFQGNDLHAVAGWQRLVRLAHLRRQCAFCRSGEGGDMKHAVRLAHQRCAIHAQHCLQRRQQRAALDWMAGVDIDYSLHLGVDDVALIQDIHQYDLDHFAQIGAVEIEHYLFAAFGACG